MHDKKNGPASVAAENGAGIHKHSKLGHIDDSRMPAHSPEASRPPRARCGEARHVSSILRGDPSISLQLGYPVHALGPLQGVVEAVHNLTQAPVPIAAQSALAAAALVAQAHADVRTFNGRSPLSLYLMSIARSGERKSACDTLMMQGVRDFEAELAERYGAERARFEHRHQAWTTRRDRMLRGAKDECPDALAQRIEEELGPEPEPPLVPLITASDPTFEGLTRLFSEGRPSLGVFTDEGGSFIGGFSMASEKRLHTMSGFSKLWDGAPINRTRALDGSATLRGRRVSKHFMVQPLPAKQLLADPLAREQGYLGRFLMVEPMSEIGRRFNVFKDERSRACVEAHRREVLERLKIDMPLKSASRQELAPRLIDWSKDAFEVFSEFYRKIEREQGPRRAYEDLTSHASKASEQAARLAAVLAWWENPDVTRLEARHAEMGCILAEFYLNEALRIYRNAQASLDEEQARKLADWLVEQWPEKARENGRGDGTTVSRRDCQQFGPNAIRDAKLLKRLFTLLAEDGFLAEERGEQRGARAGQRYRILGYPDGDPGREPPV